MTVCYHWQHVMALQFVQAKCPGGDHYAADSTLHALAFYPTIFMMSL